MSIAQVQLSDELKSKPNLRPLRPKGFSRGHPWRRSHIRRKSLTQFPTHGSLPDDLVGAAENLREEVDLFTISPAMTSFRDENPPLAVFRCIGALVQSGADLAWIWSLEELIVPDYVRRILHIARLTSTAAFIEALDVLLRISTWIELEPEGVAEIERIAAQLMTSRRMARPFPGESFAFSETGARVNRRLSEGQKDDTASQ